MRRGLCLLTVAMAALAAPALMPALAQSACMEPAAPTMPDGKTAARAEIITAAGAAKEFVTKSDDYQNCLNAEYAALVTKMQAETAKIDPKLNTEREAKITANQKKKEEVGKAYGATAAAYKQANPPAAK